MDRPSKVLTLNETCSDPISKFGNAAQKAEFLNDFASGRKLVSASSSRTRRPLRVRQQLACASIRQHPSAFSAHPSVYLSVRLSVCLSIPSTRRNARANTRRPARAGVLRAQRAGQRLRRRRRPHHRHQGLRARALASPWGGWVDVCVCVGGGGEGSCVRDTCSIRLSACVCACFRTATVTFSTAPRTGSPTARRCVCVSVCVSVYV